MNPKIVISQISPTLGNLEKNILIVKEDILKAINDKANIIVFPELSLTGYVLKDIVYDVAIKAENFPKEILKLSEKIDIVIGLVEESSSYLYYNSFFYISNGKIIKKHRKVYLPTYGIFEEHRYFKPGHEFRAFDTKYGRIGLLICEDAWHMNSIYSLYMDRAEIIIIGVASPARGVKKKETSSMLTWELMIRMYARVTTSYIIFANRVGCEDGITFWGGSEIISPLGEIEIKMDYFDKQYQICELDLSTIKRARLNSQMLKNENLDMVIENLVNINLDNKII